MRGLSVDTDVHVYSGAVIRHVVFPESTGGVFVSVKIHGDGTNSNASVTLLITEPDVLAALAQTAQVARGELIAAKTAARTARETTGAV